MPPSNGTSPWSRATRGARSAASRACRCTSISSGIAGAYIIEILNLDELAKDQAYEFLFVVSPLLLRGGIGVPVNPIAIR
jgi:hypothetical protein